MAQSIIELIKILRETTGAGMMDCKKALEACELDVDRAKDWLREKGITTAAKKEARIAAEGLTNVRVCGSCSKGIILEVNCETDFVAKGDAFRDLVDQATVELMHNDARDLEHGRELTQKLFAEATVKMGEKLSLRRFEIVKAEGQGFGHYIHMGGKISVLVVLDKVNEELAKGLAMHIAANNPLYVSKESIPASEIEHETAIQLEAAKNDDKLKGKPENILVNIIKGKVNKVLFDSTLSEQFYLLDGEKKVADVLSANGVKVLKFVRYQVGEGIEKRKDDFASEVMAATK